MKIRLLPHNRLITAKAKMAHSTLDRALGLLKPGCPTFLVIKTRWGIHTFFLKTAIDVLVLDKNSVVKTLFVGLKPYRFYFYPPQYDTVVEMPPQTISKFNIRLGDKICIK